MLDFVLKVLFGEKGLKPDGLSKPKPNPQKEFLPCSCLSLDHGEKLVNCRKNGLAETQIKDLMDLKVTDNIAKYFIRIPLCNLPETISQSQELCKNYIKGEWPTCYNQDKRIGIVHACDACYSKVQTKLKSYLDTTNGKSIQFHVFEDGVKVPWKRYGKSTIVYNITDTDLQNI